MQLNVEEIVDSMDKLMQWDAVGVADRPSSSCGGASSRDRTRSPSGQSCSIDSFSGVSDFGEPGPASYFPDDRSLAHHKHFPSATIGKGPGHAPFGATSSSPWPKDLNVNDNALSHRRRSSSVTIGRGPGHESLEPKPIAPGPTSYNPNDRLQAHHKHFPVATFGRGPGHNGQSMAATTPGPADFHGDDRVEARRRRASSVSMGSGPGHITAGDSRTTTPGPAAYDADDKQLASHRRFPSSTIGHGPGHVSVLATDSSPAPGSYNLANDSRHRLSTSVSMPRVGRDHPTAEERLRFKRADRNSDGCLEFGEIKSVLQSRFPGIKDAEVRGIFNGADRNRDGKLDFDEIIDFTHSSAPASRKRREKMLMALAAPGLGHEHVQSYRECDERMQFRRADLNLDGTLDLQEVESLMRHSFPDIKRRDVNDMFNAIDRTGDGKLDFQEFIEYTRSRDLSKQRLREKLLTALSNWEHSGASKETSKRTNSGMRRVNSASVVGSAIAGGRPSP